VFDGATGGHVSFDRISAPGEQNTVFRGLFSDFEPEAYLRSSLSTPRPFAGTSITFGNSGENVLEDGAFELVLRALALEGRAEFLAWPTVVCTEGLPGTISSVVQTSQNVMQSSSPTTASVTTRPLETGVRFDVTPVRVGSDAAVLDLVGRLSFALPEVEDGQAAGEAVVHKRSVQTRITIRDQESLLIGGLRVRRKLGDQRGLPVLTGIPGLTATSKDRLETELILLVRARVIVPGRGGGVFVPPGEARRLGAARGAPAADTGR
jgi:type II secretory pathway component GspD/PulD (secretin)